MINFKNKDSKRVSGEAAKKPQNKQKHPTKTRQTRKEKISSTIYSVTKPLVLFSPWYMDTASIECRDLILPLKKAQQTNKQNKPIKENTHQTKSKQTKNPTPHTKNKQRLKSQTKIQHQIQEKINRETTHFRTFKYGKKSRLL